MTEDRSKDDERWKIEVYKDKLRYSLSARFFLRFHVSLILAFTVFFGWVVDLALLKFGLRIMMIRYPLAVLAAYGAFLFGVYLWIEYSGIRDYIARKKQHELVGDDVPRKSRERWPEPNGADFAVGDPFWGFAAPEGCLIVMGVVVAFGAAYVLLGGYLITGAASFFAEIVLELLLAAGLLGGIRRFETGGWANSVVSYTFVSLIASLFIAFAFGLAAYQMSPTSSTFAEAWGQYARQK